MLCRTYVVAVLINLLPLGIFAKTSFRVGLVEGGPAAILKARDSTPQGAAPIFFEKYIFPELKKKFDLEVSWDLSPAPRLFRELSNGHLDMLCFVAKTPEREKLYAFSSVEMFHETGVLIVHMDSFPGKDSIPPQDLTGKTIGQLIGTYIPDFYSLYKVKILEISGDDVSQRISDLVNNKRIDGAFILLQETAQYLVQSNNLKHLKVVKLTDWPPVTVTAAYRKDIDPALKSFIDDLLRKHKGQFEELIKSYMK